jgi:hypothetical protein
MSSSVPKSCIDLDLKRVYRELVRAGGNMLAAARRLKVPTEDLRRMSLAVPVLLEAALEAEEQTLDEAEAVVREALKSDDKTRRLQAATYILRRSEAARRRGWRAQPEAPAPETPAQPLVIKWLDPKAS